MASKIDKTLLYGNIKNDESAITAVETTGGIFTKRITIDYRVKDTTQFDAYMLGITLKFTNADQMNLKVMGSFEDGSDLVLGGGSVVSSTYILFKIGNIYIYYDVTYSLKRLLTECPEIILSLI